MTYLPTRLILPIDMADRRFVVCEHSGDTFSEDEDYDGIALTLELKNPEEARAVLGALFGEQDTTREDLADTEARHAHRDLLAEKGAEIERLTAMLEETQKDTALLNAIQSEYWDLRCVDLPTGQGDADIGWQIISHHQGKNPERVEAMVYVDDARRAIREAINPPRCAECDFDEGGKDCNWIKEPTA